MPSLEKVAAYTTIIGGVCSPFVLFFAAAVFFQWTPSTFTGLGIVSMPVGVAVIALILGVCPWAVLGYVYFHRPSARVEERSLGALTRATSAVAVLPAEETITPQYLVDLFLGRTELQGQNLVKEHLGREITVTGKIRSIEAKDPFSLVFMRIDHEPPINGYFDISWKDRLTALNVGDRTSVVGILYSVLSGVVVLDKCKVVSLGR
jgi:hypothetical protein